MMQELGTALGTGFRLDRELAPGGMSQVFIAHDLTLARDVVAKVLAGDVSGVSTDRFRQEIQLLARLQHPHVVPIRASPCRWRVGSSRSGRRVGARSSIAAPRT